MLVCSFFREFYRNNTALKPINYLYWLIVDYPISKLTVIMIVKLLNSKKLEAMVKKKKSQMSLSDLSVEYRVLILCEAVTIVVVH